MARRSKKNSKVIKVDFTGVDVGGRVVPPGEYVAAVENVKHETSSKSNKPFLGWELKIVEGDSKGAKLFHNTSLQPQALWKLRQMLEALGVETEEGAMSLNLTEYVGLQLGVEVDNEEYDGKTRTRVVDVFSLDDPDEDEDDGKDEEVEDDSDEDEDEDDGDDEEEEVDEEDEEEEEEEEEEDDEDDEEDDEEEEEEEEAPAPRRRQRRARR